MVSRMKKQPIKKQTHPSSSPGHSGWDQLVSLSHGDPHSILGIHPQKDGFVIRVFRPEAKEVSLLLAGDDQHRIVCSKCHPAGLFEAFVPGKTEIPPYQVRAEYPGQKVFTYWDPYCFWPTLGELDLHLFGEGTHERLWDRLGAHVKEWQGVK